MNLTTGTILEYVMTAVNLDELRDRLIESENFLTDTRDTRLDELVDLSSLPTFGGEEPRDTNSVVSWDACRVLWSVSDSRRWAIEPREDAE